VTAGEETPVSWLLIEPGWEVVGADGQHVGHVHEIVGDAGKDIFNGLAVSHGFLGRPRYVPAERVGEITEGRVQLELRGDEIEHLDEHEEQPPSEQFRP
jgi:hypothetical protein